MHRLLVSATAFALAVWSVFLLTVHAIAADSKPNEMQNLAGDSKANAELERHRKLLAQWNQLTEEGKHDVQPSGKPARAKGAKQKRAAKKQK